MTEELYVSIDIEADGYVPGLSSMLSMAAVAITLDKRIEGRFSTNLELLEGAKPHPDTMEFWSKHQDAYDLTRISTISPEDGSKLFVEWLKQTAGERLPVFMGYPACYDYKWIDYYTYRFTGKNPFGHSRTFDIESYAWAHLGGKFIHVSKRNFPKSWKEPGKHTHIAEDDALEQAGLGINMIRAVQGLPKIAGFANDTD